MKKLFLVILSVYSLSVFSQKENEVVLETLQKCKDSILRKQYQEAKQSLEDMRQLEIYTDSFDYYLKVIDYHIDMDSVETLYQKRRFKEARNLYDIVAARHKDVVKPLPKWILRCDTIIEAQKRGEAITEKFANAINKGESFSFIEDGVWRIWEKGQRIHVNIFGDTITYVDKGYYVIGGHQIVNKSTKKITGDSRKHNAVILDGDIVTSDIMGGLFIIRTENHTFGVMNAEGDLVVPLKFEHVYPISENCFIVRRKGSQTFYETKFYDCYNSRGDLICTDFLPLNSCFSENRMWILRDYKWTRKNRKKLKSTFVVQLINSAGTVVFEQGCEFGYNQGYFGRFSNGLSYVFSPSPTGDYKYVNEMGETVLPPIYDKVRNFNNGYAEVIFHGEKEWKYINTKGEIVTKEEAEKRIYPPGFEEVYGIKHTKYGYVRDVVALRDKFGTTTLDYKE